jgi:hypothetical protein
MIQKLQNLLTQLEHYIEQSGKLNTQISSASVGWHIEHCLLTIEKIILGIEKSNPEEFKQRFNYWRLLILTFRKMPRGKANAPKIVVPTNSIPSDSILQQIDNLKLGMEKLEHLEPNKYLKHPFLGDMRLKQAIKIMEIHTQHHLNIIQDILKVRD